jgi:hypothetical protein
MLIDKTNRSDVHRAELHKTFIRYFLVLAILLAGSCVAYADTAPFDLDGPRVEVKITRAGKPLPIGAVPNLQPDDALWIHTGFDKDHGAHYVLVVAFLRGSTNPPPENWFTKAETWNKDVREEGIVVHVPKDAQQALLFLAPETSGDFNTLRSAVRARPGIFVRASQDLNQASLYRSRLDKYLAIIRETNDTDPKALKARSLALARTLAMKVDPACFDKPVEQQESCLTQKTDELVLNDGHSQSMIAALTSGPSSDLIGAVSVTPAAGGGMYSAYVGAIVDVARIMNSFRTAIYQYIPALALPQAEELNLHLNTPPSFNNPKSVLVIGLPAVEAAQLPPLRAVNPEEVFCLQNPSLVLPVEGAPLIFSTDIAHDFALHIPDKSGQGVDLPIVADAAKGGFVVDARAMPTDGLGEDVSATIRGRWGFETFDGPSFHLRIAHNADWTILPADRSALIVDRNDALHLDSPAAACVDRVSVVESNGKTLPATAKVVKTGELEVEVPLKNQTPGDVKLELKQFGLDKPDQVSVSTYAEAAHLDRFTINAGDPQGVLKGTRLDQVQSFELNGIHFMPAKLSRTDQQDELRLAAPQAAAVNALQPDAKLLAHVGLKDGRTLDLQTTVEAARPKVSLISKNVQSLAPSAVRLNNQDELPQGAHLSFFLKSEVPEKFPRNEKIEIATTDESSSIMLTVADGSLVLQDSQTVLATLEPLKSFGASAFGPLRFRAVDSDGGKGDWLPLATLVRVPSLKDIHCPDSPDQQCQLSGSSLFLIDSVASDPQWAHTVPVPAGYVDSTLRVPRPNGTLLYVKLRDDPATVNTIILPVLPED